jgi:hypothetical protein
MSPASLEHGILQVGLERVSPAVANFRVAAAKSAKQQPEALSTDVTLAGLQSINRARGVIKQLIQ